MKSFKENEKLMRIASSASGATNVITSDIVDTDGFDSLTIFAALGAITATGSMTMTIEQNTANSTTGMAALSGASASADDADDELMVAIEIYRPRERYVQAVCTPGTDANCEIDGVFAILRDPVRVPTSQSTSHVADFTIVSAPAES